MESNALLDAVKSRYSLPSDLALSKKLDVTRQYVGDLRVRGLSEPVALQVAALLDLNAGEVLASIRAERAKNPEVKAVWKKVAESMRSTLGMVAAVALAALVFAGQPIHAQAAGETVSNIHYARIRRLGVALRALFAHVGAMARISFASLAVAALVGCGQPVPTDNHGYGWHYDEAGATGLRARYYDASSPRVNALERVYQEVASCTGTTGPLPPGPLVIFTTGIVGAEGYRKYGKGFLDTSTILLDATLNYDAPLVGFWVFRHELVHFFLHAQGVPIEDNQQHRSPLFNTCTVSP